jgi:hypothetical protein
MKVVNWILLVGGALAVCALRLWLYHKMAHGNFPELRSLYTYQHTNNGKQFISSDQFDFWGPAVLMALLNGMIGFRHRSFTSVAVMSAVLSVVQAAVRPLYAAIWGAPAAFHWFPGDLLYFSVLPVVFICMISAVLWSFRRSLAHLPTSPGGIWEKPFTTNIPFRRG